MIYCVSLALSVSRLDFVIDFVLFSLLLPTYWFAVAEIAFPSMYDISWLCYYCCLSCFRMGFYFVTTGWILLDKPMLLLLLLCSSH